MTLCGSIDIGSSTLAGCVVEKNRAGVRVLRYEVLPRPADAEGFSAALRELAARLDFSHVRHVAANVDGPLFVRNLEFPFADLKKVEPLVNYELDEQIPGDVEDMVVVTVPTVLREKTEVLAAAVPRETISAQLQAFAQAGIQPYRLVHPAARAAILAGAEKGCTAVIDIGATLTHLAAVVDGRLRSVRTWAEGMESLVSALAAYSSQNPEQIRSWLSSSGHIQPPVPGEEGYEEVIRSSMGRAFEEWRRFLLQAQARHGVPVSRLVLCGAGARLAGLAAVAASFFEIPVQIAQIPGDVPDPKRASVAAQALSCLQPEILNFRRGEFAYGSGESLVKKKALAIAWGLSLFFLMTSVSALFTLWRLEREEKDALERLGRISGEVLGKTTYNPASVRKQVKQRSQKGARASSGAQLPSMSAWTLLSLISQNLPENALRASGNPAPEAPGTAEKKEEKKEESPETAKTEAARPADSGSPSGSDAKAGVPGESAENKPDSGKEGDRKEEKKEEPISPVVVDIQKLHIRSGKVTLGGVVTKAQEVDEIVRALKRIPCFQEIAPGAIKTVGSGADEKREFSIEITMDCL